MSTKKKKSPTTQCGHCGNYFLRIDLGDGQHCSESRQSLVSHRDSPLASHSTPPEKQARNFATTNSTPKTTKCQSPTSSGNSASCSHRDISDKVDAQSFLQCVVPRCEMRVLAHTIKNRDTFLPAELIGWERRHMALINPETLTQLGVLPRCSIVVEFVLETNCDAKQFRYDVFTTWPCPEVPQMRLNINPTFSKKNQTTNLRAYIARPRQISKLKLFLDEQVNFPKDFERRLSQSYGHFKYYLKSYLSNAFLSRSLPVVVNFYTKLLVFYVKDVQFVEEDDTQEPNISQALELLKLEDSSYTLEDQSISKKTLMESIKHNLDVLNVTVQTDIQVEWSPDNEENIL